MKCKEYCRWSSLNWGGDCGDCMQPRMWEIASCWDVYNEGLFFHWGECANWIVIVRAPCQYSWPHAECHDHFDDVHVASTHHQAVFTVYPVVLHPVWSEVCLRIKRLIRPQTNGVQELWGEELTAGWAYQLLWWHWVVPTTFYLSWLVCPSFVRSAVCPSFLEPHTEKRPLHSRTML